MPKHADPIAKTPPVRSTAAAIAFLVGASFALGTWSMLVAIPVLASGVVLLLPYDDPHHQRRLHVSLLLGTAMAWAQLPHSIFDFRDHQLGPIPTAIPGCSVMAWAGFPLQGIGAHGGGGWRLGCSLPGDRLTHAGNCSLLAIAAWCALGRVPRRLWLRVQTTAWILFVPLCLYGVVRMAPWWD